MRVGILDVLSTPARSGTEAAYAAVITKQFASITPQAIAVWCRELGHRTFYAAYYGVGDPRRALPDDLDVLFVATYSQASALACALARLYRRAGVRTVIGGPHAKAFPRDCLRFFDLVVGDCDKGLVADILRGTFDPGTVVSSARPFADVPTVEERMPEIAAQHKALLDWLDGGNRCDLFLSLHNTESGEYLEAPAAFRPLGQRLFTALAVETTFNPATPLRDISETVARGRMTVDQGLFHERGLAAMLMEQMVEFNSKLGRCPTVADRTAFGAGLVRALAEAVSAEGGGQ